MSKSIPAGKAFVEIGLKNRIQQGAAGVERSVKNMGTKLMGTGAAMAAAASAALIAPIKFASDLEEVMGKFNTVFGESAVEMEAWSDSTAAALGRSERQMAEFLAGTQDLLVPMGLSSEAAAEMSKQVSTLAVDLASFNNMADGDAVRDLHAALTGSGEVMKKYGVVLDEAAVKQELFNQGIDPKTADNAAKAQARFNIILRGTTAAQGDAERTSGSFANQMRRMKALGEDLAGIFGGALVGHLAAVVGKFNDGISVVKEFAKNNEGLVGALALTTAGVAVAGFAITGLGATLFATGMVIGGITSAITALGSVAAMVFSPLAPIVIPIGIAVAGLATASLLAAGSFVVMAHKSGLLGEALTSIKAIVGGVLDSVKKTTQGITDALATGDWGLAAQIAWAGVKHATIIGMAGIMDALHKHMPDAIDLYKSHMRNMVDHTARAMTAIAKIMANPINTASIVAEFKAGAIDFDKGALGMASRFAEAGGAAKEELDALRQLAKERRIAHEMEERRKKMEGPATAAEKVAAQAARFSQRGVAPQDRRGVFENQLRGVEVRISQAQQRGVEVPPELLELRKALQAEIQAIIPQQMAGGGNVAADMQQQMAGVEQVTQKAMREAMRNLPKQELPPELEQMFRKQDAMLKREEKGLADRFEGMRDFDVQSKEVTGETGTFSAFAASLIGMQSSPQERMARGIDRVADNTGRLVRHAKKPQQAVFGR